MKNCPKIDTCEKVKIVKDKGYDFPELYPEAIESVCEKCEEAK